MHRHHRRFGPKMGISLRNVPIVLNRWHKIMTMGSTAVDIINYAGCLCIANEQRFTKFPAIVRTWFSIHILIWRFDLMWSHRWWPMGILFVSRCFFVSNEGRAPNENSSERWMAVRTRTTKQMRRQSMQIMSSISGSVQPLTRRISLLMESDKTTMMINGAAASQIILKIVKHHRQSSLFGQ